MIPKVNRRKRGRTRAASTRALPRGTERRRTICSEEARTVALLDGRPAVSQLDDSLIGAPVRKGVSTERVAPGQGGCPVPCISGRTRGWSTKVIGRFYARIHCSLILFRLRGWAPAGSDRVGNQKNKSDGGRAGAGKEALPGHRLEPRPPVSPFRIEINRVKKGRVPGRLAAPPRRGGSADRRSPYLFSR